MKKIDKSVALNFLAGFLEGGGSVSPDWSWGYRYRGGCFSGAQS